MTAIAASAPQPVSPDAAGDGLCLPYSFAKTHGVMICAVERERVQVVHRRDVSLESLSEVRRYCGRPLALVPVDAERFEAMLGPLYGGHPPAQMEAFEDLGDEIDLGALAQQFEEPGELLESASDAPIIRLINALLTEAIKENASDIHIEPFESRLAIRFRVDGMLREVMQPQRQLAPLIVSRVKVMARLDIAEKRLPQDGRISVRVAGRPIDVRVSVIPSGQGERAVLRLLSKEEGRLDLEQLGMEADTMRVVDQLIHRPHGIILVTGPTGSGKTTTLYAMVSRINDRTRNIMTVEEPIEYYLDGVAQTQVNTKVDMSFARGLRAILRQDPDVVMVGEIRDPETARIAVQASVTGHLVLSTLHTNTAVGAISRLIDLGVEPFLLSSSLLGTMAQRLVRALCPECKRPCQPDEGETEPLAPNDSAPNPVSYESTGCPACAFLGFRGRLGIFELVAMDESMRRMIYAGATEETLAQAARQASAGIREQGYALVRAGLTSRHEIERVLGQD